MRIKIYIPEWHSEKIDKKTCVPLLYPFASYDYTHEEKVAKYGEWINLLEFSKSLEEANYFMPAYFIEHYYLKGRKQELIGLNNKAADAGKLTICWTKGDFEITPNFRNFHLYRNGGYLSKNKGNEFAFPPFFGDPRYMYYDNNLTYHINKTEKPIAGFCGQGSATLSKWAIDIFRHTERRVKKMLNLWPYDVEAIRSSTYDRAAVLDVLERSPLIDTNLIRHKRYRAGTKSKEEKEISSRIYFQNMKDSQYIVCYRGAGNFSVRLYETLACGRIPLIVTSDNNLPFPEIIDWKKFPMIKFYDYKKIDEELYKYHSKLSAQEFYQLQKDARLIWEKHISYGGFMTTFINKYSLLLSETP